MYVHMYLLSTFMNVCTCICIYLCKGQEIHNYIVAFYVPLKYNNHILSFLKYLKFNINQLHIYISFIGIVWSIHVYVCECMYVYCRH